MLGVYDPWPPREEYNNMNKCPREYQRNWRKELKDKALLALMGAAIGALLVLCVFFG